MARSRETKIELTAYDDLFQTDESREEAKLSKIRDIPISEIDEFPDHPFKVLMDEDMEQLVESIKRNGVMTPATVRLKEDGRYELISGHRRKKACELAGLETLKCEVKELTRDEAIIVMVESNLQRSVILPSEKAFAYKMRLEAMKRQGERSDLTSSPMGTKLRSDAELAEKVGESRNQIQRYIRLTELVPEILQMVDERQIAFRPAVEVSYLTEEQQYTLLEAMEYNVSCAADRVKDEVIHQFNKRGQKAVKTTQENIGKAKDKITDFKQSRAVKAAEQEAAQNMSEQHGLQIRHGAASRSSAPDVSQTAKSQLIKTRQQGQKMIKTTARNTEKAVKATAKGTVKTTEKGIKTAQATSKAAIKTTETSVKTAQAAAKVSAKTAQKAAQAAKVTAKATAEATKATVRATIAAVKAIIAGTKALISAIIAGGWIAVVIILIVVLLGCAVSLFVGGSGSNAYTPVSAEVEAYEPLIQKYAKQYGISEYVELIKAVMMQESGGRGLDPMQAAEGSFNTRYPHEPNGIQDPEYSIQCGVQELKAALISAEVENPIDMERIKLALQGYNFGNGYISWAKTNYGGYSYANAVEFSTMQAQRLGWEKYGDTQYPAHVLRYYPYGRAFTSGGNQAIVEVALTQLGNEGGQPYWSWYGFEGRVEWCACFVSWCADQCGYIESGIIQKFAGCVDGSNWFKGNGQWQDRNYEPQAGDIIFFDWEGDGETDHVGIVEKCENGVVYTVEGNSGDACRQKQYTVGSSSIYGYGVPAY